MINLVGVDDAGGPPVPIPNTEVKPGGAEDTWLETTWENREMPTFYFIKNGKSAKCFTWNILIQEEIFLSKNE